MSLLNPEHDHAEDIKTELSSTLLTLGRLLPSAVTASRRRFSQWKLARRTESQVSVNPLQARIDVRARDQATIDFSLLVSNVSGRLLEPDRLELDSIVVGGRNVQRTSEMTKVRGEILPRTVSPIWFTIELRGSEVTEVIRGIVKASNPWCSPQVSVLVYGQILFLAKSERFRKPVNFQWDWASSHVPNGIAEQLL